MGPWDGVEPDCDQDVQLLSRALAWQVLYCTWVCSPRLCASPAVASTPSPIGRMGPRTKQQPRRTAAQPLATCPKPCRRPVARCSVAGLGLRTTRAPPTPDSHPLPPEPFSRHFSHMRGAGERICGQPGLAHVVPILRSLWPVSHRGRHLLAPWGTRWGNEGHGPGGGAQPASAVAPHVRRRRRNALDRHGSTN